MMDASRPAKQEHIGMLTELQGRIARIGHTDGVNGINAVGMKVPCLGF
jgi:hypothetical protein